MLRRVLVAALILTGTVPAHAFEQPRPMGLYPPAGAPALAMLDSRIDVTVRGPIVETVVVQRFRNPGDRATEATYIFPLPVDAAVSAMAIQIGTRTVRAAIEPREAAQRRYEAAIAAGVGGALLEQERPDVFTQSVSAIPPHGVVEVTLRYDTLARYQAGMWELVLPMVVAPRYVPGTPSGRATTGSGRSPDTDRAPDASRVTPAGAPAAGGPTAVAIHFVDPPGDLASPTHELGGTRGDATLFDPHSDHDAIVRWRAPAAAAGWIERDGAAGFAAVVVEAPPAPARRAPIRVIVAIDRAATTRGDADAVEHPLVRAVFGALDAADRVRVIGSDAFGWNAPGEVLRALDRAWATPVPAFDLTRVLRGAAPDGAAIVLITDGLVADDRAALAAARRLGVPIHAIGIGPAPARATLRQLAAATGGTVRYAVAGDDVAGLARGVLGDVASPPAPLAVTWGTLGATDVEPAAPPRLGAGQAMLMLARIEHPQAANARTRGQVFAFEPLAAPRPVDGATTAHGPLARRWARERLDDMAAAGRDPAAVTGHALAYGLVSPYTSLVAIGSDVIVQGGVKRSVAVPVSVPSGMNWQAVKPVVDPETRAGATGPAPEPAPEPAPPPSPPVTDSVRPRPVHKAPPPAKRRPERSADDTDAEADAEADAEDVARPRKSERSGGGDDARRADKEVSKADAAEVPAEEPGRPASVRTAGGIVSQTEVSAHAGHRPLRLTASLGGGLALDRSTRGMLALDARLETQRRTRAGVEAALWLVGGADAEGRALLTVARDVLPGRLELGLGAGVHFGDGTGAAGSLRLRVATPIAPLAGSLRYDTAVLLTRPSLALEHAITLGIELSY